MNQIILNQVYKSFDQVNAIQGLDLTMNEGDIYALLGHNGAGKTTTLRLLLGLLKADDGIISVFGRNPLTDGNQIRQMCGVVSEEDGLYEPLSLYDNLIYYTDIYGMNRKSANDQIDSLLEEFKLQDKKYLPVKGFSTGMKKKAALIRAIMHKPKILILDEPTNGLDPVSAVSLREHLLQLAHTQGTTIIMTTHNLEEVQKTCNKISILKNGRAVYTNDMSSLKDSDHYQVNGSFSLENLYLSIERGYES